MSRTTTSWVVATLVALAMMWGLVAPAAADGKSTPITMSDGSVRVGDVSLYQIVETDKLLVGNLTDHAIRVDYSDPAYGAQSITVPANQDVTMCADEAYGNSSRVTVTFEADTSAPATGTGLYASFGGGQRTPEVVQANLDKATKVLAAAKKVLEKAKKSHRKVRIAKAKKGLGAATVQMRLAREEAHELQQQLSFCASRHLR